MRMRVAPWSVLFAVWLVAATALGQEKGAAPTAPQTGSQAKSAAPAAKAAPATEAPAAAPAPATTAAPTEAPAAAPGETPAATTTAAPSTTSEPIDAGTYAVRLRDLEQRINDLKEQIFRSKARLSLLAETVLQGVVGGSRTMIVHENMMSGSFKLVKAVYSLDGAPILTRADEEGGLSERESFDVFNGSIVPGEHTLSVSLEYRGHGFGVFSYLKGYRFKVRESYPFTAPEGKSLKLRVVGYEKGGPTTALDQRPAIRFIDTITEAKDEPVAAAAPDAKKEAEGTK